jgi:hypothetical protein
VADRVYDYQAMWAFFWEGHRLGALSQSAAMRHGEKFFSETPAVDDLARLRAENAALREAIAEIAPSVERALLVSVFPGDQPTITMSQRQARKIVEALATPSVSTGCARCGLQREQHDNPDEYVAPSVSTGSGGRTAEEERADVVAYVERCPRGYLRDDILLDLRRNRHIGAARPKGEKP